MNDQTATAARLPRQVPFITGNEACERFSFYGMRNILTPLLVTSLLLHAPLAGRAGIAKEVFHSFVVGVSFFPLLGGWVSHRWSGTYRRVLWLSLVTAPATPAWPPSTTTGRLLHRAVLTCAPARGRPGRNRVVRERKL
jgi:dipeptide/tripeptide permease